MFQSSDISRICMTGLGCCERTEIAKVKTDENEKKKELKRCAVSTGVVAAMPL